MRSCRMYLDNRFSLPELNHWVIWSSEWTLWIQSWREKLLGELFWILLLLNSTSFSISQTDWLGHGKKKLIATCVCFSLTGKHAHLKPIWMIWYLYWGGYGWSWPHRKRGKKDTQSALSSNRDVTNNEQQISTHYSKPESDLEPGTQICYTHVEFQTLRS